MSPVSDIRIPLSWPRHPKLRRARRLLESRDGLGARDYIENLWAYVAEHWPATGELRGMDPFEIAEAAEYREDAEEFVRVLHDECGLLDCGAVCRNTRADRCEPDGYRVHDWTEHQPWAIGADERKAVARLNAHQPHCKGPGECDREYCLASRLRADGSADGSTPSPAPTPTPTPIPSPSEEPGEIPRAREDPVERSSRLMNTEVYRETYPDLYDPDFEQKILQNRQRALLRQSGVAAEYVTGEVGIGSFVSEYTRLVADWARGVEAGIYLFGPVRSRSRLPRN